MDSLLVKAHQEAKEFFRKQNQENMQNFQLSREEIDYMKQFLNPEDQEMFDPHLPKRDE